MNMRLLNFLCCILMPLSSSCTWAGGVNVTLSPSNQVVKQGDGPRFIVKATAAGAPLRIMRFDRRPDLLANYTRIHISQGGQIVDVHEGISDPGATAESDYKLLGAGHSMSFEH